MLGHHSAVDVQDADECIKLAPTFAKGYSRKGHLQFFMKEHTKAIATYEEGLKQDPANQELRDGLQRCMEAINKVQLVLWPPLAILASLALGCSCCHVLADMHA